MIKMNKVGVVLGVVGLTFLLMGVLLMADYLSDGRLIGIYEPAYPDWRPPLGSLSVQKIYTLELSNFSVIDQIKLEDGNYLIVFSDGTHTFYYIGTSRINDKAKYTLKVTLYVTVDGYQIWRVDSYTRE